MNWYILPESIVYRFEIEKKLKRARKKEQKFSEKNISSNKSDSSKSDNFVSLDLKNRVKERKKNVEKNKKKWDKNSAMTMLLAKREEKRERGMFTRK